MKVQFALCAKDLVAKASYQATVSLTVEGTVIGSPTEPSADTTSPCWTNLVSPDEDLALDAKLTVKVFKTGTPDIVVATAYFVLNDVITAYKQTIASFTTQETDGGAKIGIHAEKTVMGKLKLQLAAHDLPNTDAGIFHRIRKDYTDAYFEVFSGNYPSEKLATSNVVDNNLNPVWDPVDLHMEALCNGRYDKEIQIVVLDQDPGDKSQKLGQVLLTVSQLIESSNTTEFPIQKGGQDLPHGTLTIQETKMEQAEVVTREVHRNLVMAMRMLDSGRDKLLKEVTTQQETAKKAAAKIEELSILVEQFSKQADELEKVQFEAQSALAAANKEYKRLSMSPIKGSLVLGLRAKNLPDTDRGLFNKSDPMYDIFLENKKHLLRSNVVENNLNPTWMDQTVDIAKVGGLSKPIRIEVWDKNSGKAKDDFHGAVSTTLQTLIDSVGSTTGLPLSGCKGVLFVETADLVDFSDTSADIKEYEKAHVEPASAKCRDATQAFEEARSKAETTRIEAATARLAAEHARDAVESAQIALERMERAA